MERVSSMRISDLTLEKLLTRDNLAEALEQLVILGTGT